MYGVIESSVDGVIKSQGEEQLPLNIIILRGSEVDGLIKSIISKELAGFKRAHYDFIKGKYKNNIKSVNGGSSKWFPGIQFSVLQENVTDSFGVDAHLDKGVRGNKRFTHAMRALVVNQKITSSELFDIFLSLPVLPTKHRKEGYARFIRLVTLCDDYNTGNERSGRVNKKDRLRHSPELTSDYIQLIYSSMWGYPFNIPFSKEPRLPSPIKFADHYAHWQYSTLTENDKTMGDLNIDIINAKPKVSHIIPPKQIVIDNDDQI